MSKRTLLLPLLLFIALALSACGASQDGASEAVLTEAARIASEGLTQTALAAPPTATNTPPPTATDTPPPTNTPTDTPEGGIPTATPTQQQAASGGSSAGTPCLRANLEYETVPDGERWPFGRVFTKTWRLKNTGTCTWNANYVIAYVDGDLMGAKSVNNFTDTDIPPNGYAEISVAFQAPDTKGTFKGYWMLRSSDGVYFGVSANGKAWIWVEIETFDPETESK